MHCDIAYLAPAHERVDSPVVLGMRAAFTLMALAAALLLVACDGGGNNLRATLTDDDCTFEGDASPAAGRFTIDFANKTEFFGSVALARLSDGKTINDLQPYLEKARREFTETGMLAAPPFPDFYEQVVRWGVGAGQNSVLAADVPAGTYALMCFPDNLPMWRVYRAAQLDVAK